MIPSLLSLSTSVVASEVEKDPECYIEQFRKINSIHPLLPHLFANPNISSKTLSKFVNSDRCDHEFKFKSILRRDVKCLRKLNAQKDRILNQLMIAKSAIKTSQACET